VKLRQISFIPRSLHRRTLLALAALMSVVLSAQIALAQTYQIRPGDTLRIEVLEDASLNRTVLVAPDGRITIPHGRHDPCLRAIGGSYPADADDPSCGEFRQLTQCIRLTGIAL